MIANLGTLASLWHKGDAADCDAITQCAYNTFACMRVLCKQVGTNDVMFPKLHDLFHVANDVRMFGSSANYSTSKTLCQGASCPVSTGYCTTTIQSLVLFGTRYVRDKAHYPQGILCYDSTAIEYPCPGFVEAHSVDGVHDGTGTSNPFVVMTASGCNGVVITHAGALENTKGSGSSRNGSRPV